jgi:hypothetical protein
MAKFIDLDENEQEKVGDLLEVRSIELGLDKWETQSGRVSSLKDVIGICYNCQHMIYCKSEFENVYAICHIFKVRLNGQDKITECNEHSPRGQMSLRDMEMIATLIETDEGAIKGFISRDPKLLRNKK